MKSLVVCLVGIMVISALPLWAADAATVTVEGWIVDDICKASNANPNGKACTLKCHNDGAKLVLYTEQDKKVYQLDSQEQAEAHVGYVRISGKLDGEKLAIEEIESVKYRRSKP